MSFGPTYRFSDHAARLQLDPAAVEQATIRAYTILMQLSLLAKTKSPHKTPPRWFFQTAPADPDGQASLSLTDELKALLAHTPCYVDLQARQDYPHRDSGYQLLHVAAECGLMEVARELLNAGAPLDSPSAGLGSPLMIAIHYKDTQMAKWLLNQGADVEGAGGGKRLSINQTLYRDRPLHEAAATNQPEMIVELVERKADLHALSSQGYTPLTSTVLGSKLEAATMLLELGANPNHASGLYHGTLPLEEAMAISSDRMVSLLLEQGADMRCCLEDSSEGHTLRLPNATDASIKYQLFMTRLEQAQARWQTIQERSAEGLLEAGDFTPRDLVLCANIGVLNDALRLPVWQAQREAIRPILSAAPHWMQQDVMAHHLWIAEVCAHMNMTQLPSPSWSHRVLKPADKGVAHEHRR